jgi:hypothetical protein
MQFGELGLGVEGVDVRRSAFHEQEDTVLGLGGVVGLLGGEDTGAGGVLGEQSAEGDGAGPGRLRNERGGGRGGREGA